MKDRWLMTAAYAYSALHILSWWIWLSSSQNESWFPAFNAIFGLLFPPLNLMGAAICRVVWGSLNLFRARFVVGPLEDGAVASLLSVTILLAMLHLTRRHFRSASANT